MVTPTADGNSVDVDYEVSDARLDAWAQRHGVPPVHTDPHRPCMPCCFLHSIAQELPSVSHLSA